MINKLKHLAGVLASQKIMIVGTGRSGTHWLARILGRHPKIRATIEVDPGFKWATEMAVDPSTKRRHYSKLVWFYRAQHLWSVPRHYVDKSHTNLWNAEELTETFSDILFLGIQRNPYATVASMLNHEGVQKWYRQWKDYPVPNEFLGIERSDVEHYEQLSMAVKCAKRWKAHYEEMKKCNEELGRLMMVADYERLVGKSQSVLREIEEFIGLEVPLSVGNVEYNALDKWKSRCSMNELRDIAEVTGIEPDEVATTDDV